MSKKIVRQALGLTLGALTVGAGLASLVWFAKHNNPKAVATITLVETRETVVAGDNLSLLAPDSPLGHLLTGGRTGTESIWCAQENPMRDAPLVSMISIEEGPAGEDQPSENMTRVCRALYDEARRQEDAAYRR